MIRRYERRKGKEGRKGRRREERLDAGTQGESVCGRLVNSRRGRRDGGMELSAEK